MLTQEELAQEAATAFAPYVDDIPDKIWVDQYEGTPFVRAAWADGLNGIRIERLEALQTRLSERYGVPFVAVAYWHDHTWREVDRWAEELKRVR